MGMQVRQVERVVVRFTGDSGDGMQLIGGRLAIGTAVFGNDLSTLPNFPAEIRSLSHNDRHGRNGHGFPVLIHDAHDEDPGIEFALARRTAGRRPDRGAIGIFRAIDRPAYDDQVRAQCRNATDDRTVRSLAQVSAGTDTWRVKRTTGRAGDGDAENGERHGR